MQESEDERYLLLFPGYLVVLAINPSLNGYSLIVSFGVIISNIIDEQLDFILTFQKANSVSILKSSTLLHNALHPT